MADSISEDKDNDLKTVVRSEVKLALEETNATLASMKEILSKLNK